MAILTSILWDPIPFSPKIVIFIEWAMRVIKSIENYEIGFLYALRQKTGAVLNVYTQTSDGKWMKITRTFDENELPYEIASLPNDGQQVQIAAFDKSIEKLSQ